MTCLLNLEIAGSLAIALGLANVFFVRYFQWNVETRKLSLLTHQVFHVHSFFIILILVLTGTVSVLYAHDLLEPTPLARAILAGLTLFWAIRALFQWFVYDSRIWRGSRLYTTMHWLFSALWIYFTASYALAWRSILR